MKLLALVVAAIALLSGMGCISPNWMRLVPENKDLDAVISTPYGTITIHSRVNPYGTNGLGPLPTVQPVPAGAVLLSR